MKRFLSTLTLTLSLTLTALAFGANGPQAQFRQSSSAATARPGLRSRVSTTSAPIPKLLPKMVPSWPKDAQMPEEHKGIWRTSNVTKDYFSRPVADVNGPSSHDRMFDALLDTRRPDKSVLMIGGVNLHANPTH